MSVKTILFGAFTVFSLSQCTEEDIVPQQEASSAVEAATLSPEASGSMTISGIYTIYEDIKDCTTCTFIVPGDAAIVDGLELKIKPGAVICLDKAVKYGDVEFVNLEGTEANPILIGATVRKEM
jgi:hypothetical protein